jgi:hypothetical protein
MCWDCRHVPPYLAILVFKKGKIAYAENYFILILYFHLLFLTLETNIRNFLARHGGKHP